MIPLTNPDKKYIKSCIQCGIETPIILKGLCKKCYSKQRYENNPNAQKELNLKYYRKHPEKIEESFLKFLELKNYKELKEAELLKKQTCKILKEHTKEMKDDPEHLTTEFMQKLIGIKCKSKRID